ncbi:MAG: hypothetical protein ACK5MD_07990 [Flavobacteriales bacterium]
MKSIEEVVEERLNQIPTILIIKFLNESENHKANEYFEEIKKIVFQPINAEQNDANIITHKPESEMHKLKMKNNNR